MGAPRNAAVAAAAEARYLPVEGGAGGWRHARRRGGAEGGEESIQGSLSY